MTVLRALRSELEKRDLDHALFFNGDQSSNTTFTYLTGLKQVTGCLVVGKNTTLYVSPLEYEKAQQYGKISNVKRFDDSFTLFLKQLKKTVGVDFGALRHRQYLDLKKRGLNMVDVGGSVERLRMVKSEEEIDAIQHACKITDRLFEELHAQLPRLRTERDTEHFLLKRMFEHEVEPSFPPIVATHTNAANIHHQPGAMKLKGLTVVDMGVTHKDYCSDVTRTFCVGKKDRQMIAMHTLVHEVQQECCDLVKDGADFFVVHHHAAQKLGNKMGHSVGHGLGLDVHELPFVRKTGVVLKRNMVVTVEPGVYLKGKGGVRIEDDLRVTKAGYSLLSKFPRELL